MKYYYPEHVLGYEKVKAQGKTAWAEIHGGVGFENFSSRAFLEAALPRLSFSVLNPTVLEYGCGTGPGACFLAERGFQVDAIDIIPVAIEMARELAKERSLDIRYEVQDICELPHDGRKYDMIVDSYCLQCIVTDADRDSVFSAVRCRLKPKGYYLVSTAMFDEARFAGARFWDAATGSVYSYYGGDDVINAATGTVYRRLAADPQDYEDVVRMKAEWYLPSRRHLKPPALKAEMAAAGFSVLYQDGGEGGNMIAVLRGTTAALH